MNQPQTTRPSYHCYPPLAHLERRDIASKQGGIGQSNEIAIARNHSDSATVTPLSGNIAWAQSLTIA
jgi:hypothetical protein